MSLKKTLIIDNYDSFTFNLVQYIGELEGNPIVYKNDEVTLDEIKLLEASHIILSPGPGNPCNEKDRGVCGDIVLASLKEEITTPLLGICMGHQVLIHQAGGEISHAPEIFHGKRSIIKHNGLCPLFKDVAEEFEAMRYHSFRGATMPKDLEITAWLCDDPSVIMGVAHKKLPLFGFQFHPESIGTPQGKKMLKNFLSL